MTELPMRRWVLVAIAVALIAGCGESPAPESTVGQSSGATTQPASPVATTPAPATTTAPTSSAATTAAPTTTTVGGLDLTGVQWVTIGLDGLRTDEGVLLWSGGGLFDKAVARDRAGGMVFVDGSDLWWFADGAVEPRLVAGNVPTRVVEVVAAEGGPVAALGYGERTYVRLSDGLAVADPGGLVTLDAEGREVWAAANGWSVWVDGPVLAEAAEGTPTVVETPARLLVADASGAIVVDSVIGTETEPWVRLHDFDGRSVMLSRGPIEPAMPEETFLVIDLGCATCTSTFNAAGSSASFVGDDADWNGPAEVAEAL